MESLCLLYRDELLRTFELSPAGVVVGSSGACDIVVHDADVAPRALAIERHRNGWTIRRFDDGLEEPLIAGLPLPVGSKYSLQLVSDVGLSAANDVRTEPIAVRDDDGAGLSLVVGRGPEARRVRLGRSSVLIGSGSECDLVLVDRAVSTRHCRIEPWSHGFLVRDLESRNGVFVDGVRSFVAQLGAGSRIRIGRTDLTVVSRGERGDAREGGLVAKSAEMLDVFEQVERLSRQSLRVLVLGETGVGKEGIARALHLRSPRKHGPFVAVNAGGLAPDLVESELFGHEKGSFTGAAGLRRGVFEQANGGTLFLDEIGELPAAMQARLLRVFETHEIRRVGSEHSIPIDVRLVCATHRDLHSMVQAKSFREDLFYRINESTILIPPLRMRSADILPLAEHFLAEICAEVGARMMTEGARQHLLLHDWPGNVRELRNIVRSAAARSAGSIDVSDIEDALEQMRGYRIEPRRTHLSVAELIERYGEPNLSELAKLTGIPRTTLRDRKRREDRRDP